MGKRQQQKFKFRLRKRDGRKVRAIIKRGKESGRVILGAEIPNQDN